jgi:hypothetical protein
MIIQRINRTDAEKIFVIAHNAEATTITTGMGTRYMGALAAEVVSTGGNNVCKLDADTAMCQFAGIADQDIASLGYGRVQAWGYCNSILLSAEADKTIGVAARAETFLKKGAVAGSFTSTQTPEALSTFAYKYVQVMNTTNISGGLNYATGFVRAM